MGEQNSERREGVCWRSLWYRTFHRLIVQVYYARIRVVHAERLPREGPVLYLGLHRNGAVDGFIYHRVLHRPVFMISTQLTRSWFARLFFAGIPVARAKDVGDRGLNEASLQRCVDHLRAGGELFVFPEGTSTLGPRHLPFKSGAARLLLQYLEGGGPPVRVVPLGIHYRCAWSFRSEVEVVAGPPLTLTQELDATLPAAERLPMLRQRFEAALEAVGVNVDSEEDLEMIQHLAGLATLGSARSYFEALKTLERAVPDEVVVAWQEWASLANARRLWRHQGLPLFPREPMLLSFLAFLFLGPIVAAAVLLNLPPLLAGWTAGRKFPDGPNVIALWRILVGIPALLVWIVLLTASAAALSVYPVHGFHDVRGLQASAGPWICLLAYAAVTWAGLKASATVHRLVVAWGNQARHPELAAPLRTLREMLRSE